MDWTEGALRALAANVLSPGEIKSAKPASATHMGRKAALLCLGLTEQELICIRSSPACNQQTHNAVWLNLPAR